MLQLQCRCVYKLQGVQKKSIPIKHFWQHFPNDWKFFSTVLHTFCLFLSTQNYKIFIHLSLILTKLCHIKRDHLVNFYISLEKRKNAKKILEDAF